MDRGKKKWKLRRIHPEKRNAAPASQVEKGSEETSVNKDQERSLAPQVIEIFTHSDDFSELDVVINPYSFPSVRVGDVLQLFNHGDSERPSTKPLLVFKVRGVEPVRGTLKLSIKQSLAEKCGLRSRQKVWVGPACLNNVSLSFVEVACKDQYVSRSGIWRTKAALVGECISVGQALSALGLRLTVTEAYVGSETVSSGVITPSTKIVFRSRSAHVYILLQLSKEMWDFADDGELYYEKVWGKLERISVFFVSWFVFPCA